MKHDMIGEVDLFGLDEFGQAVGLNPLYGAAIGGGVSTVAALLISTKGSAKMAKHSELIGFAAGAAASAALLLKPDTKAAVWTGVAAAAVTAGLRAAYKYFTKSDDSLGYATISQLPPLAGDLGLAMLQPLNGAGLGYTQIHDMAPAYGIAGPQLGNAHAPVDLIGRSAGGDQVSLMGGPTVSNLASAYGATLFGR